MRTEGAKDVDADILLTFTDLTVVCEARVDHLITPRQRELRDQGAARHVRLLVDVADAQGAQAVSDALLLWRDAITFFPGSRMTIADVEGMDADKRTARKILDLDRLDALLPAHWECGVRQPPGRSWPQWSAWVPCAGRAVGLRIETDRRSGRFDVVVGVETSARELVTDDDGEAPRWLTLTRDLCERLEPALHAQGLLIVQAPGGGRSPAARAKIRAADRWGLPLRHAAGRPDTCIGLALAPLEGAEVVSALQILIEQTE